MDAARRASILGESLVVASQDNKIIEICRLLTLGADVNYLHKMMDDDMITTPLLQAAASGQADAVRVLISRGAEVNKHEPCEGHTALHVAARYGHVPVMELLMSKGARHDARCSGGYTPLHLAAVTRDNKEATICLLDHGADVNAKLDTGFTPLLLAAHKGHLEIVDVLLSAGANINHLDVKGISPLYAAADQGHLEVAKLLVKKGANMNQASNQGLTPLHWAALNGHQEVVDYLIRKGSKFEAGGTPAKSCKCCGATDVPLKLCTGCGVASYCSPECQIKDWKVGGENSHKIQCKRLVEIRAGYAEKANREIEEKMARFGVSSSKAEKDGGEAGSSNTP